MPHMKVFDNLAFPLKMRKVPKNEIEKRGKHIAKLLRLIIYSTEILSSLVMVRPKEGALFLTRYTFSISILDLDVLVASDY